MKLNDFKAFELGKTQMNAIAGGITICTIDFGDGPHVLQTTLSPEEAERSLKASYGDIAEVAC